MQFVANNFFMQSCHFFLSQMKKKFNSNSVGNAQTNECNSFPTNVACQLVGKGFGLHVAF